MCLLVVMCFALTQLSAGGQSAPGFEVASIKPRFDDSGIEYGRQSPPDRFIWQDVTLNVLIRHAHQLFEFQITGGPPWIDSRRWDVDAKAPGPTKGPEMRQMVRRLLEERFGLKTHFVTRQLPVYELVVARRDRSLGPNIKPAVLDCRPFLTGARPIDESPEDPETGFPACADGGSFRRGLITPSLRGRPLSGLITTLEAALQRTIIDKTGLTGIYDIELSYVDHNLVGKGIGSDDDGPALLTAVQEQLGLRLRSSRGPVQVLVVDSASEPTVN
jgi:uncharacterized protein (TIGR03435 family)